jgi:hypothetical protein
MISPTNSPSFFVVVYINVQTNEIDLIKVQDKLRKLQVVETKKELVE